MPQGKPTDIRVLDVRCRTETIKFRAPLKFGGRVVTDCVLLNVTADVETRDGRRGAGSRQHADGQRLGLAELEGVGRADAVGDD